MRLAVGGQPNTDLAQCPAAKRARVGKEQQPHEPRWQRAELALTPEVIVTVPFFEVDIHDLAALLRLGERMWASHG